MYDCKAPLSRFYYPDTRRIINAFIIIRPYFGLSSCGMFWPSQVTCSWYFANLCAKWKLVHTVFPVFIFSLQLLTEMCCYSGARTPS